MMRVKHGKVSFVDIKTIRPGSVPAYARQGGAAFALTQRAVIRFPFA